MSAYRKERAQARLARRTTPYRWLRAWARGTLRRMRVREHYFEIKTYWNYDWMPRQKLYEWAREDVRREWKTNLITLVIAVSSMLLSLWWHGDRR